MKLYAATSNPGKLAEFAASASAAGSNEIAGIEVLALPGLADIPEPIEDATTFMGNAELKAVAYSLAAPGLLVMADDSGLEVAALNGAPGVRSARYADDAGFMLGQGARTHVRNNELLLQQLAHTSGFAERDARFVCALAVAQDGEVLFRSEGNVTGEILHQPRGTAGFGYDPLFLLPELGLSMAELPKQQKWEISHRGNAFRALLRQLRTADTSSSHPPYR